MPLDVTLAVLLTFKWEGPWAYVERVKTLGVRL